MPFYALLIISSSAKLSILSNVHSSVSSFVTPRMLYGLRSWCKMRFECSNTREVRLDTILCLPIPSPFTYIYIYIYSESNEKLSSSSIQICLLHKQFGRTWSPWEDINAALDRAQGELEAQGGTVWWRWKGRRLRMATCEPRECDVV